MNLSKLFTQSQPRTTETTLIFLILTSMATLSLGMSSQPVPSVEEIIEAVERRNASILVLDVRDARIDREGSAGPDGPWTPFVTGLTLVSRALVDVRPNSRFRFDVERDVIQWKEGPMSFVTARESQGRDGTKQVHVIHDTTTMRSPDDSAAKPRSTPSVAIQGSPGARAVQGWIYHAQMDHNYTDGTLGSLVGGLREPKTMGIAPEITWDEMTMLGIRILRIDFRTMGQRPSFWIQPDKGFVLRKVDFVRIEPPDSREVRHARYGEVPEIVEAAPGIWYPKRSWFVLESSSSLDSSVRFIRTTSTSGSVTINEARVMDSDFLPEIPPLYGVTEQVNNELWRATPDGQVYRERMDQRVGEARAAAIEAHRRAATRPAGPDQPRTIAESKPWPPAAIDIATGTTVLLVISILARLR